MLEDTLSATNELDIKRIKDSEAKMVEFFNHLVNDDVEEALKLVNEKNLTFPSLFLLRSQIEKQFPFDRISLRNKLALSIVNEILLSRKDITAYQDMPLNYLLSTHSTLKWMLESGADADGLSSEYDEVLEKVAIILTEEFHEKSVLPIVADIIFKRYRQNSYIHDLLWAFFEARDPQSLLLIAEYLRSSELRDVELAHELLSFVPDIKFNGNYDCDKQYSLFTHWLSENILFLRFTGDNFQQSNHPVPYVIIDEAKYINQPVFLDTGKSFSLLKKGGI
jgi:hypothetical protein